KRGPTLLAESRCGGVVELARRARHWITRLPRRTYRPKSRNHSAIRPRRALNLAPRLSEPTVSGDNTPRRPERHRKIADWPPEQGGFEPSVSREVFAKENTRECWDISGRNRLASRRECVRFLFDTNSVVNLEFRC